MCIRRSPFTSTHLETLLEDFFGLSATNGAVNGDLLVTTDTEGSDSVAGLGVDGLLASKLFQHLKKTKENKK
jgi:hypothetical protein